MKRIVLASLFLAGCSSQARLPVRAGNSIAPVDSTLEASLKSAFSERSSRPPQANLRDVIALNLRAYVGAIDANVGSSQSGRDSLYVQGHQLLADYRAAQGSVQELLLSASEKSQLARALELHAYSCTLDRYFKEAHTAYSCAISLAPSPGLFAKRAWVSQYLGQRESAVQDRIAASNGWPSLSTVDAWREERHD